MKVRIAERAEAQIEKRRAWWRTNRAERDVFDDELDVALAHLHEHAVTLPIVRRVRGRAVRRVLMPRTKCHLNFEVLADEVVIMAAWGAARGRQPRL